MKHIIPAAVALLCVASPACAETVRGSGSAQVTADADAVRASAERSARRDLVRQMLTQSIGDARAQQVDTRKIDLLASQIRPDMIVNRSAHREEGSFVVDLDADIDGAWFRQQLELYDIDSSSEIASGGQQKIFVMVDSSEGVAADYSKPAEVTVELDTRRGGSFSAKSADATSQRDASASSSKSVVGFNQRAAGASGISSPYGSAAGRYRGSSAGAAGSKADAASVHKYDHASKSSEQGEVHDDVRFREHVVYQRPPANSPSGFAQAALTTVLQKYDLALADPNEALSSFFAGKPPRFAQLRQSPRFRPFLNTLSTKWSAPFFMNAELSVEQAGTDLATGLAKCSGSLSASAYANSDGGVIGSGTSSGSAIGNTPLECSTKLAQTLARDAAADLGPLIQKSWRHALKQQAGQNTSELANYSLVLRAAKLTMSMQADILDALQSTPGVQSQNFVSQSGNSMQFAVSYAGAMPLQLALYQKLRGKAGFADMQSNVSGRTVTLCLSGCK